MERDKAERKVPRQSISSNALPFYSEYKQTTIKVNSPEKQAAALKKWRKVGLLIRSVNAFTKTQARTIHPESIISEVLGSPTRKSYFSTSNWENTHLGYAIKDFQRLEFIFAAAERGSIYDITKLKKLFETDPKCNSFSRFSPFHICNRKNKYSQTPLYVAARNGNLRIVEFLVTYGVDPLVRCDIGEMETESVLEVASRWSNTDTVKYLLLNIDWPPTEIDNAMRIEFINPKILNLLKEYKNTHFMKKTKSGCFCFGKQKKKVIAPGDPNNSTAS